MQPYPTPYQSYTRNPEEVLKELSKKWSDSQSQANSQFTFRPPSDLYKGPELQEIRLENNNITSPLRFFSTVDGYSTQLDSPKASLKLQETMRFNNEFSNGIVNRTLKAVEDAQVTSEGRNMQIELELSGLKLFDLEKKVDSCLSSSRTVLSLNSRLSPNVSAVLSHSATKDKLARLQQDYTNITRGYCSISPKKSTSKNIKISTSMMDSVNLQDLTVCMTPQERERVLSMDKRLSETKNSSMMISPVALAAKKYLENNNKENPYNLSTPTKTHTTPTKASPSPGGIATVKKPGALGRPVESQSSPIQRSTSPIESIDYNSAPHPRENRSVSTGYEEKSADTGMISHQGMMVHNRWISSANDSQHKNQEESNARVLSGEVSFREDKVDKILFKDNFVVSPVLNALSSDDSALTKENILLEKRKSTSQPGSEILIAETKAEKPKSQLPPLKTWTLTGLETQNTDGSLLPTGGRVAPKDMKGDIGGSSVETDKRNSNDSDKKILESLSEVWKGDARRREESSQEKKKYTEKPRANIRYERQVVGGSQLTRQNRSYENLHKSAKKGSEEQAQQNKRGYRADSGEEYMLKSEKDDSSIRIESEPSYILDNSVEKEIHNFLSRFDSEKARGQAREWLKKVIDGDKDSHTKSLEILLKQERRKTTGSYNSNSQSDCGNSALKKSIEMHRASSSNKKGSGHASLQKDILGKPGSNSKDMYNAKKKDVVVYSLQKGKSYGPGAKDSGKKECKSHSVISSESMNLEEKPKASSVNGFTRKKLDASSTSGLSQDEQEKLKDKASKTESVRNMAKNLEYLEYLRKDVVRSINYIEKSIQDLGDTSVVNDTSLDGKGK